MPRCSVSGKRGSLVTFRRPGYVMEVTPSPSTTADAKTAAARAPTGVGAWVQHVGTGLAALAVSLVLQHLGGPSAPKLGPAVPSQVLLGNEVGQEAASSFNLLLGGRTPGIVQRVERLSLEAGETLGSALLGHGLAEEDVRGALDSLAGSLDFRRMRPGDVLTLRFDATDRLVSLDIFRGPLEQFHTERAGPTWIGRRVVVQVDTVVVGVHGQVRTSLWAALLAAGEDGRLVAELVDIFAYAIDFYSEVRPADAFGLLVEKRYVGGHFIGYGTVFAAEFSTGSLPHRAFAFQASDGHVSYYDEHGSAMRRQLLKAPLKYAPVTSGFGVRRHPILGYTRNHNGVDYGVPVGTPVWSVGDGHVIYAGWGNGFGKLVEVAHPNGWVSQYAHLSRIMVRSGQRLRQRDVVGLVGMTGLSTGPHLHYGLKKNGRYVNVLKQRFERSEPLVGVARDQFLPQVARWLEGLGRMQVAQQPQTAAPQKG